MRGTTNRICQLRALPQPQKIHRIIDISLIALASASGAAFLLAFAAVRYFEPRHAFWLDWPRCRASPCLR